MTLNETLLVAGGSAPFNSPYGPIVQIIVWIVVIGLSLETIIGNAMVVMAYRIERNISKQVSNRYIVSLAISDLIIGIEGFPLFTVYVLNGEKWPLGQIACETWLFLDYTLCLVSILTVLLITADRYLSVCHTAKYLKWQSPTKTQLFIILSWLIPAIIFGIMIYGWKAMTGSSTSMMGHECSAPFLSNPYVNMGMYVAYYWTTLVAMLILYKGIHQAAKNLEKKAKAKERRHIALILSQRLGTQVYWAQYFARELDVTVGVSLMLKSRAEKERDEERKAAANGGLDQRRGGISEPENSAIKIVLESEKGTLHTDSEQNLCVIEEERSQLESFYRRESNDLPFPAPHSSMVNSRRTSEMEQEALLDQKQEEPAALIARTKVRLSLRSTTSRGSVTDSIKRVYSLKNDYHHESDSSMSTLPTNNNRNPSKRKYKKNSQRNRSSYKSGSYKRIAQPADGNNLSVSQNNPDRPHVENYSQEVERPTTWVNTMRARISRALARNKSTRRRNERSSSSDSSSSSDEHNYGSQSVTSGSTRLNVPQLTVTEQQEETTPAKPPPTTPKSEPFLSASGVSRKISSLSTTLTRERVISSIFAPITVFNRRRKQTKAEKRAHKAFRTITFIVGCFAILWSPYYIMATVYGFCRGECIPSLLYTLSYYMCYLNSSGNPFAYALANRQFRSAFMRMLKGNFNKIS